MPNFLALTDKTTGTSHQGRGLIEVDEKLCAHLGVEVHPVDFYHGWVDWMALYLHNDWASVRKAYEDETPERAAIRKPVLDFLEANYDLNSYATIGRR
jgi:hypothetical protein